MVSKSLTIPYTAFAKRLAGLEGLHLFLLKLSSWSNMNRIQRTAAEAHTGFVTTELTNLRKTIEVMKTRKQPKLEVKSQYA